MSETILIISGAIILLAIAAWSAIYYVFYAVRSQVLGETVWCGRGNNNSVALTFDDGPSPETEKILDVLKEENISATFFLIGKNVEKYPETVRRIVRENHEIGNHSFSHPNYLFTGAKRMRREIEETQKVIENTTGITPKIARPPYGVRSKAYFAAAKAFNLRTIQWSDTGYDWKKISAEQIAQKVLDTAQSDSIILLHDGDCAEKESRTPTVEAIPLIVQGLRKKGLQVAPLTELLGEKRFERNSLQGGKLIEN